MRTLLSLSLSGTLILTGCASQDINKFTRAVDQAMQGQSPAPTQAPGSVLKSQPPVMRADRRGGGGGAGGEPPDSSATTAEIKVDASAPRFGKTLKSFATRMGFDLDEKDWPLNESKASSINLDRSRITNLTMPTLRCVYQKTGNKHSFRSGTFWKDKRPNLSAISDSDLNGFGGIARNLDYDAAINRCPATWGALINLVWGPNAWEEVASIAAQQKKSDADQSAAWQTQRGKENAEKLAAWRKASLAMTPMTAAEEGALIQEVDRKLSQLEDNRENLTSGSYATALRGGLTQKIDKLAGLAYLKSAGLKASGSNRVQFDLWDKNYAGPALTAIIRVERLKYWGGNRRIKQSEMNMSKSMFHADRDSWGHIDTSALFNAKDALVGFFESSLAGKDWVDKAFMQKIASDLARDRPSGDPGRKGYKYVTIESKPTWMMNQSELAGQSPAENMAGAIVDFIGKTRELLDSIDKMDDDARISRQNFWECYRKRCADAGRVFYAYSFALMVKDHHYFVTPLLIRQSDVLTEGSTIIGGENVDGGPILGCEKEKRELEGALAPARSQLLNNPKKYAELVHKAMTSSAYENWQSCRDRMEYIFRPRS